MYSGEGRTFDIHRGECFFLQECLKISQVEASLSFTWPLSRKVLHYVLVMLGGGIQDYLIEELELTNQE